MLKTPATFRLINTATGEVVAELSEDTLLATEAEVAHAEESAAEAKTLAAIAIGICAILLLGGDGGE